MKSSSLNDVPYSLSYLVDSQTPDGFEKVDLVKEGVREMKNAGEEQTH